MVGQCDETVVRRKFHHNDHEMEKVSSDLELPWRIWNTYSSQAVSRLFHTWYIKCTSQYISQFLVHWLVKLQPLLAYCVIRDVSLHWLFVLYRSKGDHYCSQRLFLKELFYLPLSAHAWMIQLNWNMTQTLNVQRVRTTVEEHCDCTSVWRHMSHGDFVWERVWKPNCAMK